MSADDSFDSITDEEYAAFMEAIRPADLLTPPERQNVEEARLCRQHGHHLSATADALIATLDRIAPRPASTSQEEG